MLRRLFTLFYAGLFSLLFMTLSFAEMSAKCISNTGAITGMVVSTKVRQLQTVHFILLIAALFIIGIVCFYIAIRQYKKSQKQPSFQRKLFSILIFALGIILLILPVYACFEYTLHLYYYLICK